MWSQKATALFFLLVVVAFFAWEKVNLQQRASVATRTHQRNAAVKPDKVLKRAITINDYSLHAQNQIENATRTSMREFQVSNNARQEVSLSYTLDYSVPAHVDPDACPLPVLHPHKFERVMGWGQRKSFAPCLPPGRTNFAKLTECSGGRRCVVITDGRCAVTDRVWTFPEMDDDHFRRMTSTVDAEMRQNELRDRYSQLEKFATRAHKTGDGLFILPPLHSYAVVECEGLRQLLISAPETPKLSHTDDTPVSLPQGGIQNFLHIMIDSTSIYALRRGAKKIVEWMERLNNHGNSRVFPMKHYHAVSCCSPGNQIPMYSGNMNGEGDFFVRSEPFKSSRDWLWNIAKTRGFRTFWSLDNCPDKSARDYHAFPSVESRVVAPICLAGVLLSHRETTCLGGMSVDEQVISGLESFWTQHATERKFAAVQFITPHEETEKLLIELDEVLSTYFMRLERNGVLNNTAVIFWSDHGINFGKYAATHDGEIEKMFPFANVILPRWFAPELTRALRDAENKLITPYDMYEVARTILYYPKAPPAFSHDPSNPKLPRPDDSHIMASFQKPIQPVDISRKIVPGNRSCWDANIPMEFCTCIPWKSTSDPSLMVFYDRAIDAHRRAIANFSAVCHSVTIGRRLGVEIQVWPEDYRPPGKTTSKKIWMKPNRDMVRVHYETSVTRGLFFATFSLEKNRQQWDLAQIDRLDAMTTKCGLTDKVSEQLCICR